MDLISRAKQVVAEEGYVSLVVRGRRFGMKEIRSRIYRLGSDRVCPLCERSTWRFTPAGIPRRPGVVCPWCGARERHRLLWYFIENETRLRERNASILYFAPTTAIPAKLEESGTVVTTDLNRRNVDVRADITRLPFDEAAFDAIVCSHVLEHIPDDRGALAELYRVLKASGQAFVMVPKDKNRDTTYEDDSIDTPDKREEKFGRKNHVRRYGRDFVDRLSAAGFGVTVETYAEDVSNGLVEKYGLTRHVQTSPSVQFEDIHVCTKSPDNKK